MLDTLIIADTMPRLLGQPPPPPPPREEMIETLADRKGNEYGTREELEKMSSAELWERYRKWRDIRDSLITY